ncbi:MAG: hypothetical protein ACXWMG_04640, partial [Candidatus Limnocylindria bacterium]
MPAPRRLAAALLVIGLGVSCVSHGMAPMAISPLFDGIVVEDPYRFVNPPPGASGDPLPAKVT